MATATKSIHATRNNELQQYLLSLAKQDKTRGVSAEYNESLKLKELQEKLLFDSFLAAEEDGESSDVTTADVPQNSPFVQRWAGGAFENSPSPDDLPIPSFLPYKGQSSTSSSPQKKSVPTYVQQDVSKVYRNDQDRKFKKNKSNYGGAPFFYQQRM